jgi:hypothetical protein
MRNSDFDIVVSDHTTSVEEWDRAQKAPRSELPKLSAEQKDIAKKFEISEDEYARSVLAGLYGDERMRSRARQLGQVIQRVVGTLGKGRYRVKAVVAEMFKGRWVVSLRGDDTQVNVAIPRELADEVVDWGFREKMEDLKQRVLYGIGLDSVEARPLKQGSADLRF